MPITAVAAAGKAVAVAAVVVAVALVVSLVYSGVIGVDGDGGWWRCMAKVSGGAWHVGAGGRGVSGVVNRIDREEVFFGSPKKLSGGGRGGGRRRPSKMRGRDGEPSGNPTFSSHPELTLPEVKYDIFDPEGGNVLHEKLLDLDFIKDLHPPLHVNPLSGSTTYSFSPNRLLEMFTNEHSLDYSSPPLYDEYDVDLQFDIESDLKEIEFLLHQDIGSSLKDSIDQSNLANPAEIFVDYMPEMFTDKHALDYSPPLIFDEYDDDFLEVESDAENVYDDPFDSKGEKIKEVDALPLTNNEDKVFNPGILSQEKPFKIITRVVQDKKLATSNASLVLEDFDPPFYELPFFKEVHSIPGNLKTHAEGFCPQVFISSASLGNHVS
nr:hypothetical protein [Tanacetum cinerariifolium]